MQNMQQDKFAEQRLFINNNEFTKHIVNEFFRSCDGILEAYKQKQKQ